MGRLVAGYTKAAVKERRRVLHNKNASRHLMMASVLKLSRSNIMATKLHS